MKEASLGQMKLLEFIASYRAVNGFSPTYSEIAVDLGHKSTTQARRGAEALVKKGYINKGGAGVHRSLTLTTQGLVAVHRDNKEQG